MFPSKNVASVETLQCRSAGLVMLPEAAAGFMPVATVTAREAISITATPIIFLLMFFIKLSSPEFDTLMLSLETERLQVSEASVCSVDSKLSVRV